MVGVVGWCVVDCIGGCCGVGWNCWLCCIGVECVGRCNVMMSGVVMWCGGMRECMCK